MDNRTQITVKKPPEDVFEAFADPSQIGKFWFSSSSERWTPGGVVTLRYDEYGAEGAIRILEMVPAERIVFQWGSDGDGRVVTVRLVPIDSQITLVDITEGGFQPDHVHELLDNKEGWTYMLTCLKAYLELGVTTLRASLVHG